MYKYHVSLQSIHYRENFVAYFTGGPSGVTFYVIHHTLMAFVDAVADTTGEYFKRSKRRAP